MAESDSKEKDKDQKPASEPEGADPKQPEEPAPAEDNKAETDAYDDARTNEAVEDIVRTESDELLEAEDEKRAAAEGKKPTRGFWGRWWHSKLARWLTLLLIFSGLAAAAVVPTSRYWALNSAGVTVSASVHVVDETSGQPLKGIKASIGGSSAETNDKGRAELTRLRLGPQQLVIEEPGFARITKRVTLGLGSNPLGDFELEAVGVQYVLQVHDFVTNQPLQGAEVRSGDAVAIADKKGKAVLTLPGTHIGDVDVTVSKSGYRNEAMTIKALAKEPTLIRLVISQRAVYVSHQNGRYDVIGSDIDGQNPKVLLAGTGHENANITLVASPDGTHAALVSTRDNKPGAEGELLNTLTLIAVEDGSTTVLAQADQIQLVEWVGSRLVFEQVSSSATTGAANSHKVISYDYANSTRLQLAASVHFNTVFGAQGVVYFAEAASEDNPSAGGSLHRIKSDGSGKQAVLDKEVWTVYRIDYNTLSLQTEDGWYTYNLASGALSQVATPPSYQNRIYVDNGVANRSLWIDNSSGSGVLLTYDRATSKDTPVHTQSGLAYPVRWLTNDVAIYRVVSGGDVADYVVSLLGGQAPHRIAAVANTYGFSGSQ
jgi:hypothetical protein